ncbi:YitT family protein [Erysipelotrichaceae bacterium OttesenSCG-928-M19]|nr:YitT family protein [Erysipelotrichaceae bacterium OttesenSCG-928-M19]
MSRKNIIKIGAFLFLSALFQAFALNNFYTPSGLLSGGLTGIGLIVNNLTGGAFPLAVFLFVANVPLAILGYFNVGKRFTLLSFVNVVLTSLFITIIPQIITLDDILLNAIVGGVILGLGVGLALEAGASTGGTDFVALYMSVKKQKSAGNYMLMLNGLIVMSSAFFFNVDIAVYTLIATFISSQVIDTIHVRYQRVTLAIITSAGDEVVNYLVNNGIHGVTILPAQGGYSRDDKFFIYTVISTYEIKNIEEKIFELDDKAFINVTSSREIFGAFIPAKYD